MIERQIEIPPQPTLFDGPTRATAVVVLAGEAIGTLAYAAANPYPPELRVANPNSLAFKKNDQAENAHQALIAKTKMPNETPLGTSSGLAEAGIGIVIASAVALAGNGIRRLRRNHLINAVDAQKRASSTA